MSSTEEISAQIDSAIEDYAVGPDAVRCNGPDRRVVPHHGPVYATCARCQDPEPTLHHPVTGVVLASDGDEVIVAPWDPPMPEALQERIYAHPPMHACPPVVFTDDPG